MIYVTKIKNTSFRKHDCGGGFNGQIVRSHGIMFCGFCGKEMLENV